MNEEKRKTDRQLWEEYWTTYQPDIVQEKNAFTEVFSKQPEGKGKKFIEIGGFPGVFAVWFNKFKHYDTSLLDFYVSNEVTQKLLKANGLPATAINVIEADFFKYQPVEKFDLVLSSGFIEHFENTDIVIKKHADCLSEGGKLLITLPNLKGINGWVQKTFDLKNYNIHYVECMELEVLRNAAQKAGLKNIEVYYYGKPMVWLEPNAPVSGITRKLLRLLSMGIKLFPFKGKMLSPYLVLEAKK